MDDPDHKRRTAESFGSVADRYLASDVHREGRDLDLLASWCADADRALDVACAAGAVAGALVESGVPEVVACDASTEMVRTARDSVTVPVTVADAERLPFADDAFDAVTCRIAAHHFPDPAAFVAEVARTLAPGGVFAFEDNVAPEDPALADYLNRVEAERDPSHGQAYSMHWWRETLGEAEFVVSEAATMRRELDYDSWLHRTTTSDEQRAAVDELIRQDAAESVYEIEFSEDDSVTSFSNEKGLFRATVPE